jgi:ParB-like chromosome segregation protein Spo0J
LWRVDEVADREPDEFGREELEQLGSLADELEYNADELGQAVGVLRRRLRRTRARLRRLAEEAQEYLEDDEADEAADEDA